MTSGASPMRARTNTETGLHCRHYAQRVLVFDISIQRVEGLHHAGTAGVPANRINGGRDRAPVTIEPRHFAQITYDRVFVRQCQISGASHGSQSVTDIHER
jgi:hypothetical protein